MGFVVRQDLRGVRSQEKGVALPPWPTLFPPPPLDPQTHLDGVHGIHDRVLQDAGHRPGRHVRVEGGAGRQALVVVFAGTLAVHQEPRGRRLPAAAAADGGASSATAAALPPRDAAAQFHPRANKEKRPLREGRHHGGRAGEREGGDEGGGRKFTSESNAPPAPDTPSPLASRRPMAARKSAAPGAPLAQARFLLRRGFLAASRWGWELGMTYSHASKSWGRQRAELAPARRDPGPRLPCLPSHPPWQGGEAQIPAGWCRDGDAVPSGLASGKRNGAGGFVVVVSLRVGKRRGRGIVS